MNESGALNGGVNYALGAGLGLIFRLAERRTWYLSFRTDASLLYVGAVVPIQLARSVTIVDRRPQFNVSTLALTGKHVDGTGTLAFAANPSGLLGLRRKSILGLQASTRVQVSRNDLRGFTVRRQDALFGLNTSARFNELGVPIAFLVGGQVTTRLRTDGGGVPTTSLAPFGKTRGELEAALYYSDPKYIDAGGSFTYEFSEKEKRVVVRLTINHFW